MRTAKALDAVRTAKALDAVRTGGTSPRFSVVVPVKDAAATIPRVVAAVLAQTFADLEVVVVDRGSVDDTVAAVRVAADRRVRVLQEGRDGQEIDTAMAVAVGLKAATGRWAAILDAETTVSAAWLARLGRLIDASGARFASCGGEQVHRGGSRTEIVPRPAVGEPSVRACLRTGAFVAERQLLVEVLRRDDDAPIRDGVRPATVVGAEALHRVVEEGGTATHTPELLVRWCEPDGAPAPSGDALRLAWAYESLDVMAGTPIPDAEFLCRYATIGGVAAARLRRRSDARRLFRIACGSRPEVRKNWARLAVALVPPLSDLIWPPAPDVRGKRDPAAQDEPAQGAATDLDRQQLAPATAVERGSAVVPVTS